MAVKKQDRRVFVKALRRDPLFFGQVFFPDVFYSEPAEFHYDMAKKIFNSKKRNVVIQVPRGFGKTKVVSFLFAIFAAVVLGYKYLMIISVSGERSRQILRYIQLALKSSLFVKFYGDLQGDFWAKDKIHLKSDKFGIDAIIEAKGAGQQIIGSSGWNTRPEFVVLDDIEDSEIARNKDRVDQLERWFADELNPAVQLKPVENRKPKIIILGTPFAPDCFMQRATKWGDVVDVVKYPALNKEGKSIWESGMPTEELIKKRNELIASNSYGSWLSQYMLDPKAEQSIKFDTEKITWISKQEAQKVLKQAKIVITVDMAYTKKSYSDYTGITVVGHFPHSEMIVYKAFRGKFTQHELYEKLADLYEKYQFVLDGIYVESLQFMMVQSLFNELNIRNNRYLEIYPIKENTKRSKENRIGRLSPYLELGYLKMVEGEVDDLLKEMAIWSPDQKNQHDDTLDALAYQVDFIEESLEKARGRIGADDHNITVGEHAKKVIENYWKNKKAQMADEFSVYSADILFGEGFFNGY